MKSGKRGNSKREWSEQVKWNVSNVYLNFARVRFHYILNFHAIQTNYICYLYYTVCNNKSNLSIFNQISFMTESTLKMCLGNGLFIFIQMIILYSYLKCHEMLHSQSPLPTILEKRPWISKININTFLHILQMFLFIVHASFFQHFIQYALIFSNSLGRHIH